MIRFIDMHRDQFGVELICRVLKDAVRGFLTSRGYRAAKSRPASARQLKDELLVGEIRRLHAENYGVYGVRKMHALLRRQGWDVGRDQTARLMRLAGVRGVKRSKKVFTTKPDPTIPQPKDLVKRNFTAPAPRRLWVADITYVATWAGFAYVAFVIDVFSRMIVGWNVASTLKADVLPLQALNMAAFNATGALDELVHHADHGSNYLSIVYTDRIVELGAKPSTGTVGDSFDNALAEAVNGLYKTELIRRQGPWRTIEQVELATLEYVWWWNNQRLHGELDYRPPVEVEDAYYADLESAQPVIAGQGTDRNETQGDSPASRPAASDGTRRNGPGRDRRGLRRSGSSGQTGSGSSWDHSSCLLAETAGLPRWPINVYDDEDPAGSDTTLWDSPGSSPPAATGPRRAALPRRGS